MFKKVNFSSPIGIALMAAGVILALSPDARRAIRRFMVKGTAGVMDLAEQVGGVTAGLAKQSTATSKSNTQLEHPMDQPMVPPVVQPAVQSAVQPTHNEVVPTTDHTMDHATEHVTKKVDDTD